MIQLCGTLNSIFFELKFSKFVCFSWFWWPNSYGLFWWFFFFDIFFLL